MKYNVILVFDDGEEYSLMEEDPEFETGFDTVDEAMEAAYNSLGDMRVGAEVLNMSNPGDYTMPDESHFHPQFIIEQIDD